MTRRGRRGTCSMCPPSSSRSAGALRLRGGRDGSLMEASVTAIASSNDLQFWRYSPIYGREHERVYIENSRWLFASRRSPVRSRLAPSGRVAANWPFQLFVRYLDQRAFPDWASRLGIIVVSVTTTGRCRPTAPLSSPAAATAYGPIRPTTTTTTEPKPARTPRQRQPSWISLASARLYWLGRAEFRQQLSDGLMERFVLLLA
jgi:hypothetical protein